MAKKKTKKKKAAKRAVNKTVKKKQAKKSVTKKPTKKVATSNPLQDKLQAFLDKAKTEKKCLQFLLSLTEKQRRELAPHCIKWLRKTNRNWMIETSKNTFEWNPLMGPAEVAFFATANFTEIKKMGHRGIPNHEVMLEVLKKRKPKWASEFAEFYIEYPNSWQLVRELVKLKLCKKPTSDSYYVGMIGGLAHRPWNQVKAGKGTTVFKELKKDPELLKHDVWRLFEIEGDSQNSLANIDRFDKTNWSGALIELSKKGKLSRKRLLDSAISAMGLGFNHYRSKWFLDFFDTMQPTEAELKSRISEFLNLMSASTPNVAKWAFAKVNEFADQGIIKDKAKLFDALSPLLMVQQKGTVKAVLKLLQNIGATDSKAAKSVPLVAALALGHEKADVQKSAFKLISKYGDPADSKLRSSLEKYRPVVAASLKKDLKKWLDTGDTAGSVKSPNKNLKPGNRSKAPTFDRKQLKGFDKNHVELLGLNALLNSQKQNDGAPAIPAATFDGTDIPRLDPDFRLEPINYLEELIDTCARVMEDGDLVDDAERAIDAMARLCGQRLDDFSASTGPLFKRTVKLLKKDYCLFAGTGLGPDFRGLVYSWLKQQPWNRRRTKEQDSWSRAKTTYRQVDQIEVEAHWIQTSLGKQKSVLDFMSDHLCDVSESLTRAQPRVLLSAPTHSGGWIDPIDFVNRVNGLSDDPSEEDLVLALLRLAPDGKAKALKKLKPKLKSKTSSEWISAVKFALGADKIKIGKNAPLCIAALRSRSPWNDDAKVEKAFSGLGPDCGKAAKFTVKFRSKTAKYDGRNYIHRYMDLGIDGGTKKKAPDNIPTRLFNVEKGGIESELYCGIPWAATVWPGARESFFRIGASDIGGNLDWWEARWENQNFLSPLLDQETPLRVQGLMLLLTGLAAKEPGEYGLATDAAILSISDGRLGTDNLGGWLSEYLPSEFFNSSRLAKRFTDIAAVSDLHAYVTFRAFEQTLCGDPKKQPRGMADLIELMVELGTQLEIGVVDQGPRKFLGGFNGSTKLAKAAKALLELENLSDSQSVVAQAIDERVQRLEAWKLRS